MRTAYMMYSHKYVTEVLNAQRAGSHSLNDQKSCVSSVDEVSVFQEELDNVERHDRQSEVSEPNLLSKKDEIEEEFYELHLSDSEDSMEIPASLQNIEVYVHEPHTQEENPPGEIFVLRFTSPEKLMKLDSET